MFGEQLRNMHTVVRHTIFWNKPSGNIPKKEPQVTAGQGEAWMFRGSTICARPDFAPSAGMVLHPCTAATEKLVRILCLNWYRWAVVSTQQNVWQSLVIWGASTLFISNFWVRSTETFGGFWPCVLPFSLQIVHLCSVTPLAHSAMSAEPLWNLCRFLASPAFKQTKVYYKTLWDCIQLAEPLALAFKWTLLPNKTWENISLGKL